MAPSESALRDGVVFGLGALNNDEIRPRLDIDVMIARQPETFNLFLLALTDLKQDSSKLGYFQLAGIHGLPTGLWDDVGKDFPDSTGGYCAHGRLIFPTWHRPYLALFEQTMYRKMLSIIEEYDSTLQPKYRSAARAFRLPYWDYFRPRDVDARFPGIKLDGLRTSFDYDFRMPDILNVKDVMIRIPPDDRLEVRSNPLYSFKFTEKLNLGRDWAKAKLGNYSPYRTVRRPRDRESKYHNVQELSDVLNSGREGRCATMLDILNPSSSRYPDLKDVASDQVLQGGDMTQTGLSKETASRLRRDEAQGKEATYGSIEGIHGNFHVLIGGANGHMSSPSIAAFDPVFWLHHCNVDRIFAIWQALHPKAWFPPPGRDSKGRPLKPENEKDLLPFYKYRSEYGWIYYDSDWSRHTESFGYTYPDLDRLSDPRVIWRGVYNRYIWSIRRASSSRFSRPPEDMMPLKLNKAQVFRYPDGNSRSAAIEPLHPAARIIYKRVTSSDSDSLTLTRTRSSHGGDERITLTRSRSSYDRDDGYSTAADNAIDPYFDREWYIDNIVKRNALNGPFTIYFFLCRKDRFPDDPADYAVSPYLAGLNHIFTAPIDVCTNCGQQDVAGSLASDTIPITALLLDYVNNGVLESMRGQDVRPFLVRYLRWRVVYANNSSRDPRNMPNFEVGVGAKISRNDGSVYYESYPDVVEDIIYNAG